MVPEIDAVERRLRRFEVTGDASVVLEPQSIADAAVAMAHGWTLAVDAETSDAFALRLVLAVARLHLCRFATAHDGDPADSPDGRAAAHLYGLAERWRPGCGPRRVLDRLASALPAIPTPDAAWDVHAWAAFAAWELTTTGDTLDGAIAVWRALVRYPPATASPLVEHLANLAMALRSRHAAAHRLEDLDEAIDLIRQALSLVGAVPGDRVTLLSNLGAALAVRFEHQADAADLDEAVTTFRQAVATVDSVVDLPPGVVSNLAAALQQRYQLGGQVSDLDEAIALGRLAVDGTPERDPDRAMYLANLGAAYLKRLERTGEPADAAEAIACLRNALAVNGADPTAIFRRRSLLGEAHRTRFVLFGHRDDLTTAIDLANAAVSSTVDERSRAHAHSDLAASLLTRFRHEGLTSALDGAIAAARAAVELAANYDPNRAHYLSQLGLLLRLRYEHTQSLVDVDAAISAARAAVEATPAGNVDERRRLSNLAFALCLRAERTRAPADLAAGVRAATRSVEAVPPGHPDLPKALSNLAAAHRLSYQHLQQPQDLDAAITAIHSAVTATPADHPDRAMFLSNLSVVLEQRFHCTGRTEDHEAAVHAAETALRLSSPASPDYASFALNLGTWLTTSFQLDHDPGTAERAVRAFRSATELETAPARERTLAARRRAELAATQSDWPPALAAYQQALDHLRIWAWHGAERADTLAAVSEHAGIATDAAAAAVHTGHLKIAVELLEQGHGIALAQALRHNTGRADLRRVAPDLADRMDAIRRLLDETAEPRALTPGGPAHTESLLRHDLAREWWDLIHHARTLPGLHDFMRSPRLADLGQLAAPGPIAVINVSRHRCDALLLTTSGIRLVPLHLTLTDTIKQAELLFTALHAAQVSPWHELQARQTLNGILGWLWNTIAAPVLETLGFDGRVPDPAELPRMWWYPTGPARFLPIHAAGYHAAPDCSHTSVPHRVVSSYVSTLTALQHARARGRSRGVASLLAVATPDAPDMAPLPQTAAEIRAVAERFPRHTTLIGEGATRDAILNALPDHSFLHFAGHGGQNPFDVASGALYPHDHRHAGTITIPDIARLRLDNAHLAYLSACETARGVTQLPDEAVHISGALHGAGFTHTIATQWVINDSQSARMASHFYTYLNSGDPTEVAMALHLATQQLRDRYPEAPTVWAPYTHTGP